MAKTAAEHPSLRDAFDSAGLYLFGDAAGVPRYWGKTQAQGRTLRKRLLGRYVGGGGSQCQLAVDYEQQLIERGLGGFPEHVRASSVRRRGAVDFAERGIAGIWFALLPMAQVAADDLEPRLICVGAEWNIRQGYPRMVNIRHALPRKRQVR